MTPNVIYRNEHFLAVDKPAGWLSVPSRIGAEDSRPCLGPWLEKAEGRRIWPVHRLDLEVGGLILYALDAEAHRAANGWFERHEARKTYEAWSVGEDPQGTRFEWRCKLARGKKRAYEAEHGKDALTIAQWLGRDGAHQRWFLEPRTGRSHQLRYEMMRHGQVIVGDVLYGSTVPYAEHAIALRAVKIELGACAGRERLGLPGAIEAPGLNWVTESQK